MNAILGISSEPNVVPLRLLGVDARPESLEAVLCALAADSIELRSIVRTADQVSIVVPAASLDVLPRVIGRLRDAGIIGDGVIGAEAAPVSVVGARLNARLAIAARMFRALSREGINSECLSTSEARIWCLVDDGDRQRAMGALREEFVDELAFLREDSLGI
jgi:aspartate kinase